MATRPSAAPSPARRRAASSPRFSPPAYAPGLARARVEAISLDHAAAMESALGPGRGLPWSALRGHAPRLAAAREQVHAAHAEGATPLLAQLAPERAEAAEQLAAAWHKNHDEIVVFGEPSAVRALSLACPPAADGRVRWVGGPSVAALRAALGVAKRPLLVLVGQAAWVPWAAGGAAPTVPQISLNSMEDGVFAPFSTLALALGARCGAPPAAAIEACAAAYARGQQLHQDIARRLAGLSVLFEGRLGLGRLDLAALSDEGATLAGFIAQSWASVVCKQAPSGALRQPGADAPRPRRIGDEGDLQRLFEGPGDGWSLLLDEQPASGPGPQAPVVTAEASLAARAARPFARLSFTEAEPAVRLATALIFLEAALTVAMLRRASPLEMPTADLFREGLSLSPNPALDAGAAAPQES